MNVSLTDIAAALAVTKSVATKRAKKESWIFEDMEVRGGKKRLYPTGQLPRDVRDAVLMAQVQQAAAALPMPVEATPAQRDYNGPQLALPLSASAVPALMTVTQALRTSQLDAEIARDRIFKFVAEFAGSAPRAIDFLNAGYHAGNLPGPLQWAMDHAWNKRRVDTRLNRDTLQKWKLAKKQRGRSAPLVRQKDFEVKPWYALAVALKQRPQGSSLQWITEQIAAQWLASWGSEPPSYFAVRRFFNDKFSQIDQLKGRHTGSALAPHKHFTQRTSVGLMPWDEIHADGWNTHFTAPHPVTGDYVTYEVWHAHDVATRYVPPFGIGLSENFEVIAKCVENAIREGGCMAILQTDSTRIVKNSARFKTDPATALADRVGFTIVHPKKVGNSQANGIAENFNTWLGRECKELATYQADDMDSLTLKRVKKLTAKAVKAARANDTEGYDQAIAEAGRMGKGLVLQDYRQALEWLEAKRKKWNDRPHSALPKLRDPQTGRMRHQSPNEALQAARAAGWAPELFAEDYLVALFRPHMRTTVRREAVSPYGGMRYHHADLGDWNGKEVVVAYDIMDWQQVWVKNLDGELICVAEFSEATGYRTQSAYEAAEEKRANARIKHRERQIDTIREQTGRDAIEGEAVRVDAPQAQVIEMPSLSDAELEAVEARYQRPQPQSMMDMAMWLFEDKINADRDKPADEVVAG